MRDTKLEGMYLDEMKRAARSIGTYGAYKKHEYAAIQLGGLLDLTEDDVITDIEKAAAFIAMHSR